MLRSDSKGAADDAFEKVWVSHDWVMSLNFLPAGSAPSPGQSASSSSGGFGDEGGISKAAKKKQAAEAKKRARVEAESQVSKKIKAEAKAAAAAALKTNKGDKGVGKAGAKGDASRRTPRMPAGIQGEHAVTPAGERICYGYNLVGGCTLAMPGQKCKNGWHVCCRCFQAHSFLKCGQQ